MYSTSYSSPMLMKVECSQQIFKTYSNLKFNENSSSGNRVIPFGRTDGQTDMTKLRVAFRNFANAHKNKLGERIKRHF
jgi:hypothetical protein